MEGECFAWSEGCEHEVWFDQVDSGVVGGGDGGGGNGGSGSGGGGSGGNGGDERVVLIVDVANALLSSLDDYLAAMADGGARERRRHEQVHARARREFEREEREREKREREEREREERERGERGEL